MDQAKSLLRTVTSIKVNFTMVFYMEMENSFGAMESSMKVNLQITESQDTVYIDGLTEVYIKVKLKTALDMGLVNTLLNKRPIKANGSKGKNKAREKLFLRAEVYLKDLLKMI